MELRKRRMQQCSIIRVPTLVVSMLISTVNFVAFAIAVTIQQAHANFDRVLSCTISMDLWRLNSSSPTTPFEPNPISLDVVSRQQVLLRRSWHRPMTRH